MGMLEGKVAVVTGGTQGIGAAIVELFLSEGAKVCIGYSRYADKGDDRLIELGEKIGRDKVMQKNIHGAIHADFNDGNLGLYELLKSPYKAYGRIDILVNNAGTLQFTPYDQITEELWNKTHTVNLKAPFFLTKYAARMMKKNEPNEYGLRGSIINMSSISAKHGGMLQHHYCPTKAGLDSLVACFSESLGPDGIRVNGIAPGTIVTNLNKEQLEANPEGTDIMRRNIPLQRLGTPEDVAQVALFLANDTMSRYVNGAIIDVTGGWHTVLAGQSK